MRHCKNAKRILMLIPLFWSGLVTAQTNVVGSANLSFEDLGYDCAVEAHGIAIHADISGLSGDGGQAGLNAFVLTLAWDEALFHSATTGADTAGWSFITTETVTSQITLVGTQADPLAPNKSYHLASLYFTSAPDDVTLTAQIQASSLGTRIVAGDGPDTITLNDPGPLTFTLQDPSCGSVNDPNGDGITNLVDVALLVEQLAQGSGTAAHDCNGSGSFTAADITCLFNIAHPLDDDSYVQTSLLDFDASGSAAHLFTDGLMLALFVAGVTDPLTLTAGLINQNGAGRSNPAIIYDYLSTLAPLLDVDGNGNVDLFTDVAMLWLFMAGVRGDSMVNGLIGSGATRTTASEIETYLTSLSE